MPIETLQNGKPVFWSALKKFRKESGDGHPKPKCHGGHNEKALICIYCSNTIDCKKTQIDSSDANRQIFEDRRVEMTTQLEQAEA